MESMQIDLHPYSTHYKKWLSESFEKFVTENPDTEISTVGLQFVYAANAPHVSLSLDTSETSDACIASDSVWYGEDEHGKFGNNPPDYFYADLSDFVFDDFPDLFGPEPPPTILNITSLDNESYPLNLFEDDDATLHRIYFPFIV